jgi:hypothetical protein
MTGISPLSLDQLTRDTWGSYDAAAIAQLAGLAEDQCYSLKWYKAPGDNQEVFPAYGYVPYGMRVTPGSLLFGFYLPLLPNVNTPDDPTTFEPPAQFTVQIKDQSLDYEWFDDPVSGLFLANYKPTGESVVAVQLGSFPNLLNSPYPVVGSGLFMVEIQSTAAVQQRIQLVFGALEVCTPL